MPWSWLPWRWSKGRWGEFLARWYLRFQGYRIVETNWRCPLGEVDIIARDGKTLCFVEVKRRVNPSGFSPESSLTPKKMATLKKLVSYYLKANPQETKDVRIDFVAIDERKGKRMIRLYKNLS